MHFIFFYCSKLDGPPFQLKQTRRHVENNARSWTRPRERRDYHNQQNDYEHVTVMSCLAISCRMRMLPLAPAGDSCELCTSSS